MADANVTSSTSAVEGDSNILIDEAIVDLEAGLCMLQRELREQSLVELIGAEFLTKALMKRLNELGTLVSENTTGEGGAA